MHGRVLLAEEDRVLASSLRLLLSRNDYGVVTVSGAEEAVARLAEDPDYDAVLLDVGAGAQGDAWCKQVRDQGFRSPIILLATPCTVEDKMAGLTAGADDYITSPSSSAELLARVEAQVQRPRNHTTPEGEQHQGSTEELLEITEALVISGLLAQEKATAAIEKAEAATKGARRLRSLVEGLDVILWEADAATWQYSFVSQRAEQLLGYPIERWLADPDFWIGLIHPQDRAQTMDLWQSAIQEDSQFSVEYRALTADNRVLWLRNLINVVRDAEGHPQELRGVIIDITEGRSDESKLREQMASLEQVRTELEDEHQRLLEANARLKSLAMSDALTGLKNRRAFEERLEKEFQRTKRYHTALSIILMDVDHFKNYNDTLGHLAGDVALSSVGRVLQESARSIDLVVRYGGEEFAVIAPHADIVKAKALAERLRKRIQADTPVTSSFGISTVTAAMKNETSLIAQADRALYYAKEAGRNQVIHVQDIPSLVGSDPIPEDPTHPDH